MGLSRTAFTLSVVATFFALLHGNARWRMRHTDRFCLNSGVRNVTAFVRTNHRQIQMHLALRPSHSNPLQRNIR